MSLNPYGRLTMDGAGESAESMTSTLKGMLKINGNNEDEGNGQDHEGYSTLSENENDEISDTQREGESVSNKDVGEEVSTDYKDSAGDSAGGENTQRIDLSQVNDGDYVPIISDTVLISTSPAFEKDNEKGSGSNKVRIKPITKFEWEHKYYAGSLVSVTDNYIAYAIKSRTFAVRVISRKNSSDRLLLKGFTAPVCDVAFASTLSAIIAAVDEAGSFFIWELVLDGDSTNAVKKLHVNCDFNDSACHRLVWSTSMHYDIEGVNEEQLLQLDEIEQSDLGLSKRLLAVSHGKDVEVWDVNAAFGIAKSEEQETDRSKLLPAYMTVSHDDIITDCVLSPEGSVIAVASNDGYVKFWNISEQFKEAPTCLHKWMPHDDKPVSMVTFCDDKTQSQVVLYWRFMLTGCCQNSELKVWCTVSWDCLQKITFLPTPGSTEISPSLKCVLHAAADYLVVADVNRNVVYVLRCETDVDNAKASLTSISQYLLTTPILSFAVTAAQKCKFKTLVAMDEEGEDKDELEDEDSEEDEDADVNQEMSDTSRKAHGVMIKLVSINGKSLESLHIRFVPDAPPDESLSYSTYNTIADAMNLASVDSFSGVATSIDKILPPDEAVQHAADNEDLEKSGNKTAVAGPDAEQSTILVNDEDSDSQNDDKEVPVQDTPQRVSSAQSSKENIVDKLAADDPPLAHSSPSVRGHYDDTKGHRGQGEGEASSSPGKPDGQPVLLTPDAFTSSLRKPEDLISVDTTFTHVTPFSPEQHPMHGSERNTTLQGSVHDEIADMRISPAAPPGFSIARSGSPSSAPASLAHSTLNKLQTSLDNLDDRPSASSQGRTKPAAVGEPGPFGDNPNFGFITRGKSPDLISSTSSIENLGNASADGRILIGGPAPGGSGDAVFQAGAADETRDVETASNTSRKSDAQPTTSASWPKAPDVTMSRPLPMKISTPSSREEFLRASNISQKSNTSSVRADSALHSDMASGEQITPGIPTAPGNEMMELVTKLKTQQDEMLKTQHRENKRNNQNTKNMEAALKRLEQQNERLERAIRSLTESQKKFQTDSKSQSTSAAEHSSKIERSLKHEMRNTVLPSLARTLDPLKDQLHATLAQKLTATDSILKENIAKLARSKDTVDAIGDAVGRAVESRVHGAFKDSFMQIVVPAVEKSCNVMFQQVSLTFQRGLDEGVEKLEKQLKSRVRSESDKIGASEKQAREAVAELKDTATQLNARISSTIEKDVQKYVRSEMKRAQDQITDEMSKLFRAQHDAALKEQRDMLKQCVQDAVAQIQLPQGDKVPSPPPGLEHRATPARRPGAFKPTFEQQQHAILAQMHQGNLNAAFQRALSASDLSLVMFVCEMVDPALLFGGSSPLHQPIILSLIQQLSCDLSRRTTLKLIFLEEAVMSVDRNHQVTKEHLPTVMDALAKSLDSHVAALNAQPVDSANAPVIKQMKMLSMAAKSMRQQK